MVSNCLHLPVDFEMREDVRKLVHVLAHAVPADSSEFAVAAAQDQAKRAALFFVRIWTDWARAGVEWRPLESSWPEKEVDWTREPLTHIIESYCGWDGPLGEMMRRCVMAGVLELKRHGELLGVVARDFWRYNEHLSPGYRTMQSRGGRAKAAAAADRQLEVAAGQQVRMLPLDFTAKAGDVKPTEEEQRRAVGLIMRVDRACGHVMRATSEYSQEMVGCAIAVIRQHDAAAVTAVERYLHRHRENPAVVKVTEQIIGRFDEYLREAAL